MLFTTTQSSGGANVGSLHAVTTLIPRVLMGKVEAAAVDASRVGGERPMRGESVMIVVLYPLSEGGGIPPRGSRGGNTAGYESGGSMEEERPVALVE